MIKTLPEIISSGAQEQPNQIAFICGNKRETFESMRDKMNQVSNALLDLGVQKGDRIGIYMLEQAIERPASGKSNRRRGRSRCWDGCRARSRSRAA